MSHPSHDTIASRITSPCVLMTLCFSLLITGSQAQDRDHPQITLPPTQTNADEVVVINTNLLQASVTVVDRQGRFVDGLRREEFELLVDGKPQALSFFDAVTAGTEAEERSRRRARGDAITATSSLARSSAPGRTVIFFIDDLRLAFGGLGRLRKSISRFIEDELRPGDQAAITSTSGQIGFLQQLTDNKAVLHRALARLNYRQSSVGSMERPPITEFQAVAIEEGKDQQLFNLLVTETLRENNMDERERPAAANIVAKRVRQIIAESANDNRNTLASLASLTRTAAAWPGRKLVFFASDGFILHKQTSDVAHRLRRITDAAVRAGLVIYTLDTRGLSTGGSFSAESSASLDAVRLTPMGENMASQEPLRALAYDTGGRALLNTNDSDAAITRTLQETARYYLLAWQPDAPPGAEHYRRLAVSIKGRPELTVLVQRGFLTSPNPPAASATAAAPLKSDPHKATDTATADALLTRAPYPRDMGSALRVALLVGYTHTANAAESLLTVSLEVNGEPDAAAPAESAEFVVDVAAGVFGDNGKVVTGFKRQLAVDSARTASPAERRHIVYGQQLPIKPGLYQVRVSVRERGGERSGTAMEWIEVPGTKNREFALSSIFIGEETAGALAPQAGASERAPLAMLNPDRRFKRASHLHFFLQIYNARRTANGADVRLAAKILRGEQAVITTPEVKVLTPSGAEGAETTSIPFASQLPLAKLPVGRYRLIITATDHAARSSASQYVDFIVE